MSNTSAQTKAELLNQLLREMRLSSSFDSLHSQAVADRLGMHATDIETMDLLNTLGPMTAGELSEHTGLSSGATTRLIDRLERPGYVRRRPDEADRRRVIIELVPENLGQVQALFEPMSDALQRAWANFSKDELAIILTFARESNAVIAEQNMRLRRS